MARLSEIPAEARPLIQHLVEQRLLATDVDKKTGEATIEPAHEALLRQWGLLQGWLAEDAGLLAVLEGVKRASPAIGRRTTSDRRMAHAHGQIGWQRPSGSLRAPTSPPIWSRRIANTLRHAGRPRRTARRRQAARAGPHLRVVDRGHCWPPWLDRAVRTSRRSGAGGGLIRPFLAREHVALRAHAGGRAGAQARSEPEFQGMRAQATGQGLLSDMVVVPAGSFMMGSLPTEKDRDAAEGPQHIVTIAKPFAVAKFELTFDEWDTCVAYGDCPQGVSDGGWGRGQQPVIFVTWDDAQRYAAWLSKMTGKPYRLLTEAEYEYATRAGTTTAYPWGNDIGKNNANCNGCGSKWDNQQTAPVGSFKPNAFGLYDMVGNVFEWVEDCVHANYDGAPTDGSAWIEGGLCTYRLDRGGSWNFPSPRSAYRNSSPTGQRIDNLGFRVGRTLIAP